MKGIIYVCEQCQRETKNVERTVGWLALNVEEFLVTVKNARGQMRQRTVSVGPLDFCSITCLGNYIVRKTSPHVRKSHTKNR